MIILNILNDLEQKGVGSVATDLFMGELPLNKQDCIAAVSAPSAAPKMSFDVYEQTVDFWSRYKNSDEAYTQLEAVQTAYHRKAAYTIGDTYVYFSHSLGAIEDMDRDGERKKLYKLSVRFIYRPAEITS